MLEGRCMRCKDTREMKDFEIVTTAKGGLMAKGKCVKCGCGMCKILSKDQAEKLKKAA